MRFDIMKNGRDVGKIDIVELPGARKLSFFIKGCDPHKTVATAYNLPYALAEAIQDVQPNGGSVDAQAPICETLLAMEDALKDASGDWTDALREAGFTVTREWALQPVHPEDEAYVDPRC